MADLGGRVIACLEARHASELADLVTRHHGITYPAPCLREIHEPDAAATRLAVDRLCGGGLDAVVFLTGVGVQTIVEGARHVGREQQLLDGLAAKWVAARGPKAQNALRKLGVRVDIVAPEPYTSESLLSAIAARWDLRARTVLVQLYGAPVPAFSAGLAALGAQVIEVAPYRWERPLDEDAVARLIEDMVAGWIDVLAATNAAQVDHLFGIAHDRGYERDLRRAVAGPRPLVAAQGIVCASAFEKRGIAVDLISPRASMGALMLEIARHVSQLPPADSRPAPDSGTIAVLACADVSLEDVRPVVRELPITSTVAVLAGKRRRAERALEQAAVECGLAVRAVVQKPRDGHPADFLVRGADRVLIVTRDGLAIGRLLQLAERYAKPVRVVRLAGAQESNDLSTP
jgi:uroporphyrinogen-III synthase